jgi:RNA polymerase sigma-70 factor, ECF subfamily
MKMSAMNVSFSRAATEALDRLIGARGHRASALRGGIILSRHLLVSKINAGAVCARTGNTRQSFDVESSQFDNDAPGKAEDWFIPTHTHQVTGLLLAWGKGDEAALNQLIPLVHDELRRIARRCMAGERGGHSLQATALVNEAYLRLIDVQHVNWQNRAHFLAMSARLMRRILVDLARSKGYVKRGGEAVRVTFDDALAVTSEPGEDLVALDDALKALATLDERKAQVIELRFFGGLSVEETASVLKVSVDTVMRDWKLAKAWLQRELQAPGARGRPGGKGASS